MVDENGESTLRKRLTVAIILATLAGVAITTTGASAAASGTLTVRTLARNGGLIKEQVQIVGINGSPTYHVNSFTAVKMPQGKYVVTVDIWNPTDNTDTLGAQVVTVGASTTANFYASRGLPWGVSLDSSPGADYSQSYHVRICAPDGGIAGAVEAYNGGGSKFYILPYNSSYISLGYMSTWEPNSGVGDVYSVSGSTHGLSSAPITFKKASLATVNVRAHSGETASGQTELALQPNPANINGQPACSLDLYASYYSGPLPASATLHVSAGNWVARQDTTVDVNGETDFVGATFSAQTFVAGKTYTQVQNWGSWGPNVQPPYVNGDGTLNFDTGNMIVDPVTAGYECCERSSSVLSLGGTVLSSQTNTDWEGLSGNFSKKLTKNGWYLLQVDASRYRPGVTYPSTLLSPKTEVKYFFYAGPKTNSKVSTFNARFVPQALSMTNQAAPGSLMPVNIWVNASRTTPTSVAGSYSLDGGKTWTSVTVVKPGTASSYTMKIPSPASGFVTLRSTVRDSAGDYTVTTVYNAYSIS